MALSCLHSHFYLFNYLFIYLYHIVAYVNSFLCLSLCYLPVPFFPLPFIQVSADVAKSCSTGQRLFPYFPFHFTKIKQPIATSTTTGFAENIRSPISAIFACDGCHYTFSLNHFSAAANC